MNVLNKWATTKMQVEDGVENIKEHVRIKVITVKVNNVNRNILRLNVEKTQTQKNVKYQ